MSLAILEKKYFRIKTDKLDENNNIIYQPVTLAQFKILRGIK